MKNTIKKIKTTEIKICNNPSHNLPTHILLEPGEYEHKCPGCGKITSVNIPSITC